ncbi:MAG: hypothetical protein VX777_06970 [Chlamydiota bacterium]|nr:hypothetical protein [Chlamydiota bacterium]
MNVNALVKAGISMLDEAREVVFPKRVPVEMKSEAVGKTQTPKENNPDESKIEDDFKSKSETAEKQGKRAKQPEGTENFLK